MTNLKLHTGKILYSKNNPETYNFVVTGTETSINKDTAYNHQTLSLLQDVKKIINSEFSLRDLIQTALTKIKGFINFQSFFIRVFKSENILFEYFENCDNLLINKLHDYGYIKLALEEKKSLIIYSQDNLKSETQEVFVLIPIFSIDDLRLIFCITVDVSNNGYFNQNLSVLEIIFDMLGKAILINLLDEQNQKLQKENSAYENYLKKEIDLSTVGKVCLKAFHNLKNRTQVLVSSFNLLQKLVSNGGDEKLEKIFSILNDEIPNFSRTIKILSDVSKNLANKKSRIYFDFDRFIYDIMDVIRTTGVINNLKIDIENITQSKVYGCLGDFIQSFMLLFLELEAAGIKEVKLSTKEDALRIILTIKIEENSEHLIGLLNENSSVNFAQIKNLFKSNYCNLLTKFSDNFYELLVSIPKRSSQINVKELEYAKDFNC